MGRHFSYVASVGTSAPYSKPIAYLPPSITNLQIYEAFKAGYDLTPPSGIPWSISVTFVATRPFLERIRIQLLKDKFSSESELRENNKDTYKKKRLSTRETFFCTTWTCFPLDFIAFRLQCALQLQRAGKRPTKACPSRGSSVSKSGCLPSIMHSWNTIQVRHKITLHRYVFSPPRPVTYPFIPSYVHTCIRACSCPLRTCTRLQSQQPNVVHAHRQNNRNRRVCHPKLRQACPHAKGSVL